MSSLNAITSNNTIINPKITDSIKDCADALSNYLGPEQQTLKNDLNTFLGSTTPSVQHTHDNDQTVTQSAGPSPMG